MKCQSRFVTDQGGLATIEYALLLAFVGVAVALAMAMLGTAVAGELSDTTSELTD